MLLLTMEKEQLSPGDCSKNVLIIVACGLAALIHKTTYLTTEDKSVWNVMVNFETHYSNNAWKVLISRTSWITQIVPYNITIAHHLDMRDDIS